jgi:hypothetical protein
VLALFYWGFFALVNEIAVEIAVEEQVNKGF